jgi:hypothetical protein
MLCCIISAFIAVVILMIGSFTQDNIRSLRRTAYITGEGESTNSLEYEYRRYTYVKRILGVITDVRKGARNEYEARNIAERWFLSMVNFSTTFTDEVFSEDIYGPDCWYNKKLTGELIEKFSISPSHASSVLAKVLDISREYKAVCSTPAAPNAPFNIQNGVFTYKDYRREIAPERVALLLSRSTPHAFARMILRYAAILPGSQHWNMPKSNYQIYDDNGVTIEGFASPINAQLITIDPSCHFCSLFPDVDAPFGSIGNFFKMDFVGKKVAVNPPYTEELFDKISSKMEDQCEEANRTRKSVLFYVIFTAWEDAEGFRKIKQSKWCHYGAIMPKRHHYYVNTNEPGQPRIVATFNTVFFAVSTGIQRTDYSHLFDGMKLENAEPVRVIKDIQEVVA